ncbi:hypothetical protein C9426_35265 [Serratia sp. S1B]|nr:hypothetical protein C9426_35265 [Serratia sp. S1B]
MAIKKAYYGQDKDRDYFERVFQSANINFLIGSGASMPAIRVLGNIEDELQNFLKNENEQAYFSTASNFLKAVWDANNVLLSRCYEGKEYIADVKNNVTKTQDNYKDFFNALEMILNRRRTGLLPRRINIFTTNYDLFIEDAAIKNNTIVLNDGFSSRANLYNSMQFDARNFYHIIHATGNLYNYSVELPTVNLIKLHGSLSWEKNKDKILYSIKSVPPEVFLDKDSEVEWVKSHALILPRKEKFKETLLENIYYDLLRMFSNELDKEGTVLFVFGFSFADEHIEMLTKKALRNATLKIIIFAYDSISVTLLMDRFRDFSNVELVYSPGGVLDFKKMNEIITCYLGKL